MCDLLYMCAQPASAADQTKLFATCINPHHTTLSQRPSLSTDAATHISFIYRHELLSVNTQSSESQGKNARDGQESCLQLAGQLQCYSTGGSQIVTQGFILLGHDSLKPQLPELECVCACACASTHTRRKDNLRQIAAKPIKCCSSGTQPPTNTIHTYALCSLLLLAAASICALCASAECCCCMAFMHASAAAAAAAAAAICALHASAERHCCCCCCCMAFMRASAAAAICALRASAEFSGAPPLCAAAALAGLSSVLPNLWPGPMLLELARSFNLWPSNARYFFNLKSNCECGCKMRCICCFTRHPAVGTIIDACTWQLARLHH